MEPLILAIDTSCDETAAAVTWGIRVLSNVIASQVDLHQKYGGVYPALAKRAHRERIDGVVSEALKRAGIAYKFQNPNKTLPLKAIAVTQGPGLAIALEVGIQKAKELSQEYSLPLIAVNHLAGHLYSPIAQNRAGQPQRELVFPALALLVSGGHTQLTLVKGHGRYETVGQTLDDACGEALDKAARILKLGYPGGPIIERLAQDGHPQSYHFNPTLTRKTDLNFSYSGLKTQFNYLVERLDPQEFDANLTNLAASFQEAAFEQIIRKTSKAIEMHQPKLLLSGGGVIANRRLRFLLRRVTKGLSVPVYFPNQPSLITDNAAMIGVAAYFQWQRKEFSPPETIDRLPRFTL